MSFCCHIGFAFRDSQLTNSTLRPTILVYARFMRHAFSINSSLLNTGEYFWARVETSLDCLDFILIT